MSLSIATFSCVRISDTFIERLFLSKLNDMKIIKYHEYQILFHDYFKLFRSSYKRFDDCFTFFPLHFVARWKTFCWISWRRNDAIYQYHPAKQFSDLVLIIKLSNQDANIYIQPNICTDLTRHLMYIFLITKSLFSINLNLDN